MEVPICFFEQVLEQCIRFLHKPRPSAATRPCPHVRKSCRSALTGSGLAGQRAHRPRAAPSSLHCKKQTSGGCTPRVASVRHGRRRHNRRGAGAPQEQTHDQDSAFASLCESWHTRLVGRIESQRVLWEHTGEALDTGTGVTVCVCAAAHEGPRPKARRQEQGARPKASKAARS